MTRPHLPPQAGGDPARPPAREMANEPASPADDDDFPDAPDANRPGHEPAEVQDQPDLDRFASRLGLRDRGPSGSAEPGRDGASASDRAKRAAGAGLVGASRVAAVGVGALASVFGLVTRGLERAADRLGRAD